MPVKAGQTGSWHFLRHLPQFPFAGGDRGLCTAIRKRDSSVILASEISCRTHFLAAVYTVTLE